MATVNTQHTAGYKTQCCWYDDDDGGGFFSLFLQPSTYLFYFHSWQRWYFYLCIVFIVDFWTHTLNNNNTIMYSFYLSFSFLLFFVSFWLLLFFILFVPFLTLIWLKAQLSSKNFSVGLHWLKQYQYQYSVYSTLAIHDW